MGGRDADAASVVGAEFLLRAQECRRVSEARRPGVRGGGSEGKTAVGGRPGCGRLVRRVPAVCSAASSAVVRYYDDDDLHHAAEHQQISETNGG